MTKEGEEECTRGRIDKHIVNVSGDIVTCQKEVRSE